MDLLGGKTLIEFLNAQGVQVVDMPPDGMPEMVGSIGGQTFVFEHKTADRRPLYDLGPVEINGFRWNRFLIGGEMRRCGFCGREPLPVIVCLEAYRRSRLPAVENSNGVTGTDSAEMARRTVDLADWCGWDIGAQSAERFRQAESGGFYRTGD